MISQVQTNATLLANNSQHCSMFYVASVCTPCCMLSRVVGICCAKFKTGQTFSYTQTDATTPNNIGSCWPTMLRPFAPDYTVSKFTEWPPTSRNEWIMVGKNLKQTSFLINWLVKWPIKFTAKILHIISTMHSSVASVLCPNHSDCSLDLCYLFSMSLNQLIFTAILRPQSSRIIFQKKKITKTQSHEAKFSYHKIAKLNVCEIGFTAAKRLQLPTRHCGLVA